MGRPTLLALWLLTLGACATPPDEAEETTPRWTYESTRDSPSGRGLLSGDDGEFALDDLRRWRD